MLQLTDGGMETTLIFDRGVELPCFAAFPLLDADGGRDLVRDYWSPYLELARRHGVGLLADTTTWRANRDWGAQLGYSVDELARVNRDAVAFVEEIRRDFDGPVVINGSIGPRGDAYAPETQMSAEEAEQYHGEQIRVLADTSADMVGAYTLTYADEAIGVIRAARAAGIPVSISFTVETDGRLPDGTALRDAIERVDEETDGAAAYFMINCAHPTHFERALEEGPWLDRIGGLRANASKKSHAELDASDELDSGDPVDLAREYEQLRPRLRNVTVVGGCCGTDQRHIAEICRVYAG